ncbi:MAG: DUF6048 family protein [Bacteroidales bacterium]|nr:DUF6048 family protein [Bacteroidales bacterium]
MSFLSKKKIVNVFLFCACMLATTCRVHLKAQDTLSAEKNEIFVAFDSWGLAEQLLIPGKFSVIGRIGWIRNNNFILSSEGGNMFFTRQVSDSIKSFNYNATGYFLRAGFEKNIFRRNRPGERNFILIGSHLAYSSTQHSGTNIIIPDKYWGTRQYSFPKSSFEYVWIDFSIGIRSQLSRYFALGWELKINRLLYSKGGSSISPYYIAGFGKSKSKTTVGINYYLYYTLAW